MSYASVSTITASSRPAMNPDHPLLKGLNAEQAEAVQTMTGPLLVLAGAGSGKTRVLTHQIAAKLEAGIYPGDILAVTFTNKAAREMRARLEQLAGQAAQWAWMGTFHSICGRILRREIDQYVSPAGRTWNTRFVIYDESESLAVVKDVIKKMNLDEKLYAPKTTRYFISNLKNMMMDSYQYATEAKDYRSEKIAQIYDAYEAALSRNNALDFDDMLLMAVKLLQQNPEVLIRYHQKFKHILVDEFQDTNDVQYALIRMLAEGPEGTHAGWTDRSLTVVGDVDQSIYSWRGANFKIIMNFQEDFPDAKLIKLETNYRSTATILNIANAIIENNSERIPKSLLSVKGTGEKVHCFEAQDDREEALYVLDRLLQHTNSGANKPGECCILYRTNVQSRVMEDALISRGIPYTIVGGIKFYERREIKDVLAYLTVLFNESDNFSVKRALNVPRRGIGPTSIDRLEKAADAKGISLYEVLKQADQVPDLKPKAIKAIGGFVGLVESLKNQANELALDQLILAILDQTGYYTELQVDDPQDNEGRIANVEEFISVAKQFEIDRTENANNPEEEASSSSLADFLTQMALLSDIDGAEPADNKFVMMTIHSAKGLEYPVVALVGLEESLFPHFRSLNDKDQMEEERRLMYVAVTRAEDKLFLSYARRRLVMGEFRYSQPSRFLKEIPGDLMSGTFSLDAEAPRQSRYDRNNDYDVDVDPDDYDRRRSGSSSSYSGKYGGGGGYGSNSGYNSGSSNSGYGQSKSGYGSGYKPASKSNDFLKKEKFAKAREKSRQNDPDTFRVSAAGHSGNTGVGAVSSGGGQYVMGSQGPTFNVGQRVTHAKFGEGTIAQVLGEGPKTIYGVKFDAIPGQKLLDPKIAKLEAV